MVVVVPTNASVLELRGIHLFHANRSNCSARVRLLLEEKELDWTSHHIDLGKKENISEEYFGINPKGVVPALVHDGTVIVESNDILSYIEEKFPEPRFRAVSSDLQSEIDYWLRMSGDLHIPGIKTFQYYKLNAALLEKTDEELALYRRLQSDPELLAFHDKHSEGRRFSQADADAAAALLDEYLARQERAIGDGGWLVGASYTLADISWSPTVTTLTAGGFDFGRYPNIQNWYERISRRPQFQKAVIEWRNQATYAVTDPTIVSAANSARLSSGRMGEPGQ